MGENKNMSFLEADLRNIMSRETPSAVLLKDCCLEYFCVFCTVRFSGRDVCDAKSLVPNDVLISKVGVIFNLHELRVSGDKKEETAVVEVEDGSLLSRAVEACALNDLRLTFKIDKIREAIFGQQGYDALLLETRESYEGMINVEKGEEMNRVYWSESMRTCWQSAEDRKRFVLMMAMEEIINGDKDIAPGLLKACVTRSLYCKQREEADIGEALKKLQELSKLVRTNAVDSYSGVEAQFDYGITLPQCNLAKSVMNMIGACPAQLNCNFWEVILRSDVEPLELSNRTITKGISCKISRKESFIDVVAMKGTELEAVLKKLEISTMEEKLLPPELNTPLKLTPLNEMPDGPVNMATISSTVARNLAKRKAVKREAASRSVMSDSVDDSSKRRKVTSRTKSQVVLEESDRIAEEADMRLRFEVKAGLLEEQCRAKAREKMVVVVDDEFKKFARTLRGVQLGLQDRSIELEKRISQLEGEKNQFEENLTRKREAFQLEQEKEREVATLKLKEVRAESVAEAERLVTASATSRNSLEIESSRLRVVYLEGLLEVEKKSSTELQKELDVAREREEQILLYNAEYAEEYEALISQYEDRLDDNVKLSPKLEEAKSQVEDLTATILSRDLYNAEYAEEYEALISQYEDRLDDNVKLSQKLEEAKSQVEDLTATILSRDFALNKLTSELTEFKEKAASGSRNVRWVVQRNKEMNERINQLCARISELEREFCVRELKYEKDLKFEIDKRDGKIASGEGCREMKEFLHRKEELVENIRIDLTNSRQKSIDLTRQMR
ncbi:hypothetical protein GIB67_001666 [Kingdonia uniflora]|uniref:Uncharacterized protein n=1 Tax=Kingdonia uniflora TaxID=39325 RepID=A0A7J7PC44_9MAGN|nr:hypothetical protein GIB67_001666 [Kingdonia uniflora]